MGSACRKSSTWYTLSHQCMAGNLRDVLSRDLRIYGCFRNGELVGGCPLFVKNLKGILKVGSSTCIMTDYCGPLIKEGSSSKASKRIQETHEILEALREFLCGQGFDSIHLKFSPGLEDIRPFTWNDWNSKVHYTHYPVSYTHLTLPTNREV